jgi:hypothetical protein
MILIKRCKVCYGWISKRATRCKHCNSPVGEEKRPPDEEFINYINSGFVIIEKECATLEAKIDSMKGSFCPRHEYSEEDLMYSSHIQNVQTIAERIGNELSVWEAKKLMTNNVRIYYENRMNALRQKISYMFGRIKFRKKTTWDNVNELLMSSYYFLMNIAFYHIRNFMIPNIMNNARSRHDIFNMFGHAADFFESFMNEAMNRHQTDNNASSFGKMA